MKHPIQDSYDEEWWYLDNKDDLRTPKKLTFKEPHSEGRYQEHRHRRPKQTRVRDE